MPLTVSLIFSNGAGAISEKMGTATLFMVLAVVLCVTVGVLFTFRRPYLQCIDTAKRGKSLSKSAAVTEGTAALTGNDSTIAPSKTFVIL